MSTPETPNLAALSDEQLRYELARVQERSLQLGELLLTSGFELLFTPTAEAVRSQADHSFTGYKNTLQMLATTAGKGIDPSRLLRRTHFDELLEDSVASWATKDQKGDSVLGYVTQRTEADPTTGFTLVAKPTLRKGDVPKRKPESLIQAAFKDFAKGMPNATTDYIYADYGAGYDPEAIYGAFTEVPGVRFSLVPTTYTPEIEQGTATDQRTALTTLQRAHPARRYHIDSPLAQLTRLNTLKASLLPTEYTKLHNFNLTFTRNIDLDVKNGRVPRSCVLGGGNVSARGSVAAFDRGARVAVG